MKEIILYLLLFITLSLNAQVRGKVIRVSDGDTVVLLDSADNKIKIRLYGIDAPESKQPFGKESTEYLTKKILNKTVSVETKGIDIYKRTLGVIYLKDKNVNAMMVRNGYAWNYKYSKDKYYIKLQQQAKAKKKGLWQDENAIDPWLWRKENKKKK